MAKLTEKESQILDKAEQITKDKFIELFKELYESKGDLKFAAILDFAITNAVIMYVNANSEITKIPPLQIFTQMCDKIITQI